MSEQEQDMNVDTRFNAGLLVTTAVLVVLGGVAVTGPACAESFSGPYVGVDGAYEDYGSTPGKGMTLGVFAGWDFRLGDRFVVGPEVRYTAVGQKGTLTQTTTTAIATARTELENQVGLSARGGYLVTGSVLLYGQVGHEWFRVEAKRTVRAPVCAPPTSCVISVQDFSFNETMWTFGGGAEWSIGERYRLRAGYSYGDSEAYGRHRFTVGFSVQY
jgi:outer membrane immunogenic protein